MRYQIANVMMISKIPFHRVAWVIVYTGWMKCNPNIRSIIFCIPVGVIAIIPARIKWMKAIKLPKTNPVLHLLSMWYYGKKIKKRYFFIKVQIAKTTIPTPNHMNIHATKLLNRNPYPIPNISPAGINNADLFFCDLFSVLWCIIKNINIIKFLYRE